MDDEYSLLFFVQLGDIPVYVFVEYLKKKKMYFFLLLSTLP